MISPFPPNSRYYGLALTSRTLPDGTVQAFVKRRIIPGLERYLAADRYRTLAKDRIDGVASTTLGDPELYWRLCDANGDSDPKDAAAPTGRLLIVPLPLEVADNGRS